jgi:L-rhamnose-H+ transport protein
LYITLLIGVLLAIAGGALEGLFSLPVTRTPRWRWENIWGMGLLIALVAVPWPLAILTVPHLWDVFSAVKPGVIIVTFLFGVGWGIGSLFWGKAIAAIGMALGVSLMMGLINVFGSPLLLAITNPHKLCEMGGMALLAAVAVTVVGVVVCALAGRAKERENVSSSAASAKVATPFAVGLVFCIVSGILSSSVNFGLVFGEPIAAAAKNLGASDAAKNNAIWALVFTGNFSTGALYCIYLMAKNRTARLLISEGSAGYWFGALFLGLALPLGIVLYGVGANQMGTYGAYIAFPMMLVSSILFGNLAGAVTGEWQGASRKTKATMLIGVVVLVVAFAMFGVANHLLGG